MSVLPRVAIVPAKSSWREFERIDEKTYQQEDFGNRHF
jgi:hypothetical protein